MPVIRDAGKDKTRETLRDHLTGLLFKELMGEATRRGPVVIEDPTAPYEMDVFVVWDAWRNLPPNDREAVIRDAYSRYSQTLDEGIFYPDASKKPDDPIVPKIMNVIGATGDEAIRGNLLPFSIRPVGSSQTDSDEVETLMLGSGAFETSRGLQFRLPSRGLASVVCARLSNEMPQVDWSIEEISPVED